MAFCVLVLTVCATFAKALIEGNGVKLSGDDSFKTIVVPLCKALSYSKKVSTKGQGRTPRPSFILCACVVDAPMLLVDDLKNPKEPIFTPWIRLVRQEANKKIGPMENPYENYYVDVVHSAYFESYIQNDVLRFFNQMSQKLNENSAIIKYGGTMKEKDYPDWSKVSPNEPS